MLGLDADSALVFVVVLLYVALHGCAICLDRFPFSGGLAEEVTEKILHAAFIPFGDVLDIQIPLDYETGQ